MVTQREAAIAVSKKMDASREYDLDYCVIEARKLLSGEGEAMAQVFDVLSVNYEKRVGRKQRRDEKTNIFWRIGEGSSRKFRLYNPEKDGPVIHHMEYRN